MRVGMGRARSIDPRKYEIVELHACQTYRTPSLQSHGGLATTAVKRAADARMAARPVATEQEAACVTVREMYGS